MAKTPFYAQLSLAKSYYGLTKPGIIYGNALTAIGGFLLASRGQVNLWLLLATIMGTSLVIASACVINNYIDRGIDQKMDRTKKRALVTGEISVRNAIIYAILLGIIGFATLALLVNWLVVLIGVVGFIDYVVFYGLSKRRSTLGTLVGSISGATPVIAGYCAVTNRFDLGALILFAILVIWQMPHFYAIAMYRLDDYKAANIPVLPVIKGMRSTKVQIISYIVAFILAVMALTAYGYAGRTFMVVMSLLGLLWLRLGIKGFRMPDEKIWGRQMFRFSLIIILSLSVMLSVGTILP